MARAAILGRLSWLAGQLVGFRDETATARTLVLDVPGWPGHLPGQHVDVRLTAADGYSTERSYSIASAPDGSRLELTIQRLDDGEVSPYLTEVLSRRDPLELRGPIGGYFAWHPADRPPVLLIGGGSGVVPLMAMVRTAVAVGSKAPMRLIYSVRSPGTALYAAELERITAGRPQLSVALVYTRSAPADWTGPVGRLDADRLRGLAWPQAAAGVCFTCGPTGFVESIATALTDHGMDPRQIKTERFGPSGGT